MKYLIKSLVVASACLGGCSTYLRVGKVTHQQRGGEIHGVRIVHQTTHLLALEVDYSYDNSLGDCVFVGVTTACSGAEVCKNEPVGAWAYTPSRLIPGRNRGRVLISMNSDAPNAYLSDELHIELYQGGKGSFAQAQLRYKKHWVRNSALPAWASNWCEQHPPRKRRSSSCGKF